MLIKESAQCSGPTVNWVRSAKLKFQFCPWINSVTYPFEASVSTAVKWGWAGQSLRPISFLNFYTDLSTGCNISFSHKNENTAFYEGYCLLKVSNFPLTFIILLASTFIRKPFRFKDIHKFQFANSGKQKDQKNNLMLLQAVEQARKTENETKSTSKMMDATQAKGCFRREESATAPKHMAH